MYLLKRTLLWGLLLLSLYIGGKMVQGEGQFLQGMGFISLVIALICCYFIFRLMSGMINYYVKYVLFAGVLIFAAYCIGLFGNNTWSSFISGEEHPDTQNATSLVDETEDVDALALEMFGPEPDVETTQEENRADNGGIIGEIKSFFSGANNETVFGRLNPADYPAISGVPNVKSSSVLWLNGVYIKMFGIDGPDPQQKCADHRGNAYECGYKAITWLQNWLHGEPVTCHILGQIKNNQATGICFAGDYKYDVAAIVVKAGWAVAYTQNTDIYVAYEQQAAAAKRGLWQGTFYKPWDWRKIQSRKANIKVKYTRPKVRKKSNGWFDFNLKGLF